MKHYDNNALEKLIICNFVDVKKIQLPNWRLKFSNLFQLLNAYLDKSEMAQRTRKIETFSLWTSPRHLYLESPNKNQPIVSISREPTPSVGVSHGSIPSTGTWTLIHINVFELSDLGFIDDLLSKNDISTIKFFK